MRQFLLDQRVQCKESGGKYEVIEIDLGRFAERHVDTVLSFVPDPDSTTKNKFKVLVPDPAGAVEILKQLQKEGKGGTSILDGKQDSRTIDSALADRDFMGFQDRASNEITEYVVGKLATELNLDPTKDFILVPVLYTVFGECLIPYTANLVNMLVVPGVPEAGKATVVVQTPYGPVVGDDSPKDAFLKCLEDKLQPCNVTVAVVDGWDVLHAKYGEVHCATNAIRIPPPPEKQWWEK